MAHFSIDDDLNKAQISVISMAIMHKFSCYETLAQLIDICKSLSHIPLDYLTNFTNIVLKIIFPIIGYVFHIYTGLTNFKTDYVCL